MGQDVFRQAERRFRWLTEEHAAGRIDSNSYRSAIGEIRVTDSQQRLWMLQEGSGIWHRWSGERWLADSPYNGQKPAGGAVSDPAGGSGGKIVLSLLGVILFWVVVEAVVWVFVPDSGEGLALGIAVAGLISLVLTAAMLLRQWEGEVIDLRTEQEHVSDEDGSYYRTVTYAYIREPSGKVRRLHAPRDWSVGDYLQKRRGESQIRKLN